MMIKVNLWSKTFHKLKQGESPMKQETFTKKIVVLALFAALSLIVFMIENQFPPLWVPGARMGLANIFSLAALVLFDLPSAFVVMAVRTVLGGIFTGNVSVLLYSFTGGAASLLLSAVLFSFIYPKISLLSVSIAAAVCHNIIQNLVFSWASGTILTLSYMPYLILLGVISGTIVGGATLLLFQKIPLSTFGKLLKG